MTNEKETLIYKSSIIWEKEVTLNNQKINIITNLPKEQVEDNNTKILLDNTIKLEKIREETNNAQ